MTGRDFRYDLAAWHEFLSGASDEYGYRHPYAWDTVRSAIVQFIHDADRKRLVRLIELEEKKPDDDPDPSMG
jgi:hypothetical protein